MQSLPLENVTPRFVGSIASSTRQFLPHVPVTAISVLIRPSFALGRPSETTPTTPPLEQFSGLVSGGSRRANIVRLISSLDTGLNGRPHVCPSFGTIPVRLSPLLTTGTLISGHST